MMFPCTEEVFDRAQKFINRQTGEEDIMSRVGGPEVIMHRRVIKKILPRKHGPLNSYAQSL
jgi:hypothetical protein